MVVCQWRLPALLVFMISTVKLKLALASTEAGRLDGSDGR